MRAVRHQHVDLDLPRGGVHRGVDPGHSTAHRRRGGVEAGDRQRHRGTGTYVADILTRHGGLELELVGIGELEQLVPVLHAIAGLDRLAGHDTGDRRPYRHVVQALLRLRLVGFGRA